MSSTSTLLHRVAIEQNLSIYFAAEQKQYLLEALATHDALELDLSAVAEMDTAGLQLLILLKREAQRQGKQVSFCAHTQAVREVIDFCSLATELGDPLVIPAKEAN
jgi:anti-anti-sigma factor